MLLIKDEDTCSDDADELDLLQQMEIDDSEEQENEFKGKTIKSFNIPKILLYYFQFI